MTQTRGGRTRAAQPRASTLDRPRLMRLAATEYDRFGALLAGLRPEEWARPTECPGWDVRAMAGHALGMAEMAASVRDGSRQQRAAKKRGGVFLDELTALQVEEHAGLTTQQLVDRYALIGPRAARARRRVPGIIRRRTMPIPQLVGGRQESWTIGYLIDTILTRDPWMHRIDIGRATGRAPRLTADHDGVLVADVVAEWAARHRQPCRVELSGPAGGSWSFGHGGPTVELDGVEFCRTVSGREAGSGLLATELPF